MQCKSVLSRNLYIGNEKLFLKQITLSLMIVLSEIINISAGSLKL